MAGSFDSRRGAAPAGDAALPGPLADLSPSGTQRRAAPSEPPAEPPAELPAEGGEAPRGPVAGSLGPPPRNGASVWAVTERAASSRSRDQASVDWRAWW